MSESGDRTPRKEDHDDAQDVAPRHGVGARCQPLLAVRYRRGRRCRPAPAKVGMVCTPGTVDGSTHTFNLVANTGYIETPDGNSVFMWSYATPTGDAALPEPRPGAVRDPGSDGRCQPARITCPRRRRSSSPARTARNRDRRAAAACWPPRRRAGRHGELHVHRGEPGHVPLRERFGRREAGRDGPVRRADRAPDARRELRLRRRGHAVRPQPRVPAAAQRDRPRPASRGRDRRPRTTSTRCDNRYFAINGREFPDTIQDNGSALLPNQPYGALVRIQPNDTAATRCRR